MPSWGRSYMNFGAHERPTVGDTKTSAVTADHLGWLVCDGRLLNPTEFQDLFKVVGFNFGRAGPLFRLPDPAGRVLGYVGAPIDANPALTTRYMGGLSGEETHLLTIAEMPTHNHGTNASDTVPGNNLTGISGEHIHGITDPGHTHSYVNQPNVASPAVSATTMDVADNGGVTQTTGSTFTGITINAAGNHQHTIASQGGSDPHNNIQPTVWIGNLFIYSGKTGFNRNGAFSGAFPNTVNTNLY